jgi:hypothetical protein
MAVVISRDSRDATKPPAINPTIIMEIETVVFPIKRHKVFLVQKNVESSVEVGIAFGNTRGAPSHFRESAPRVPSTMSNSSER